VALGNNIGVAVYAGATDTIIGGTTAGAGNLISGNANFGVEISSNGTTCTLVQGNYIGTDVTGTAALGNGSAGVSVDQGSGGNVIGGATPAGNVIAFNGGDGVLVDGGTSNRISQNSIFANANLGIELLNNGNDNQAAPDVVAALENGGNLVVFGTANAAPGTTFTLEFFVNPTADPSGFGQGKQYVGSVTVTTNASGLAIFAVEFAEVNVPVQFLAATATDPGSNTSAFSNWVQISG
jgi:hypothetical protein